MIIHGARIQRNSKQLTKKQRLHQAGKVSRPNFTLQLTPTGKRMALLIENLKQGEAFPYVCIKLSHHDLDQLLSIVAREAPHLIKEHAKKRRVRKHRCKQQSISVRSVLS